MIDFSLTEEQQIFKKVIVNFAEKEIKLIVDEYEDKCEYPKFIFKKLGELGYLKIKFKKEFGGSYDFISYLIMIEEFAKTCAGITLGIYCHLTLAGTPIAVFGTEAQKQKYLLPAIKGEKIGALGLTEADAGSDLTAIKTTAKKNKDGYTISGSKLFTTNGTFADFIVISAYTDKTRGVKGISLFIVNKDTKGFSVSKKIKKIGVRCAESAELLFENCFVPYENLLGEENLGFYNAMKFLTEGRIVASAFAVGLARAAFEESIKYAKQRVQFRKSIGSFQGIQWILSDMSTEIDAAKSLMYHSAYLYQNALPHLKEASESKLFATKVCTKVCESAVQIHGGYGFCDEYKVSRFYRDCKVLEIGEGTSEIHRNIIAKQIGL
jgi:butyryl-CoA dehydrogenase